MEPHMLGDLFFTNRANLNPNFINKVLRKCEVTFIDYFPKILKSYMQLQGLPTRQLTPYAFGLFLQAYSSMSKLGHSTKAESERVLDFLHPMFKKTTNGLGVGNASTQRQSRLGAVITDEKTVYVPAGAECYWGLISLYEDYANEPAKSKAIEIAVAFRDDFQFKSVDNKSGCFDYSNASDGTYILNANALLTATLSDASKYIDIDTDILHRSYNYLRRYLDCRFIPYAGIEDSIIDKFHSAYDCYHTGFLLRSMLHINSEVMGGGDYDLIIARARDFFKDFVYDLKVSCLYRQPHYDIHAYAEYIKMYGVFYRFLSESEKEYIETVIIESFDFFVSKVDQRRYIFKAKFNRCIDEYMPLWGQAAMMSAIAFFLVQTN